jgi:polyferredoxin
MTSLNLALAHAVKLALLVAFVGVLARGRVRQCWALPAYLLVVFVTNFLVTSSPDRFHTPEAWVIIQGSYDLLKMLVVLELAWRAFAVFPGALRSARVVLLALLAASTVAIAFFTPPSSYATVWEFQPSIVAGTLWLLTATALLVVCSWSRSTCCGATAGRRGAPQACSTSSPTWL